MNSRHFLPHRFFTTILLILFLTVTGISTSMAQQPGTSRVSIASDGTQGNDSSDDPAVSADGRYVAFRSGANNLVNSDTNDAWDIFVHDRQSGETSRVSVASGGSQGDNMSYSPSISADGRYVAFVSEATNLVSGDTNNAPDVFVHDRQTGETSRVSVASDGSQGNPGFFPGMSFISANGRYVAFMSDASNLVPGDTNNALDIFVHDRQTGDTGRVSVASDGSQGNNWSYNPSISADGRYVAFDTGATNLVPGDTNNARDIFVHDRQTGETSRVSIASDGSQGNAESLRPFISGNGNYVTFDSEATNLVPGDTNGASDIFVHNRQTGETSRVSVASDGSQGGENGWAYDPSISTDGRYVAFESSAGNLVPQDDNVCIDYMGDPYNCYDIFVHDRQTAQTSRVSVASDDTQGNDESKDACISANGRYVAFESYATNLVADDTNETCYDYGIPYNCQDVFVRDRGEVAQSEVYLPVVIK